MTSRPTEPPRPGYQWVKTDLDYWVQEKVKPTRGQHPHAKLKADARAALSNWKQRTGISAYYLPYFVGSVLVGDGRTKRKALVGKKGAADSFIALLGTVLAAECKTGDARATPDQIAFRDRWLATGNPYVLYRNVAEFVDALDQIAAQRGRLF